MKIGVHLPLIVWPGRTADPGLLLEIGVRAERAGFAAVSANDHLVFARPWFDSLVALAAVAARTRSIELMTSVALPVVRGPVALAKALAALDQISGGRLIAGLGAGSSRADYQLVGVPFEERWARFDEAVRVIRAGLGATDPVAAGHDYATPPDGLEPRPVTPGGPPLWIGSWGSSLGLRRVARLGDGWLASAYHVTPEAYEAARSRLDSITAEERGAGVRLPGGLATGWLAVTPDRRAARRLIEDTLAPVLHRPADELAERVFVGPESLVTDRLARYAAAGLDVMLLWPIVDEVKQVEQFGERILPRFG